MCASVEKRGREGKRETLFCRASPVSCLQSRVWSFACLGRFARRTKKKRETTRSLTFLGARQALLREDCVTSQNSLQEAIKMHVVLII